MAALQLDDAQDKKENDKSSSLRDNFVVSLRKLSDISIGNQPEITSEEGEKPIFSVSLTALSSIDNQQMWQRTFTKKDCIQLRKDAKLQSIPLNHFIDEVLYCLSEENTEHALNFKKCTTENDNNEYLSLNIEYVLKLGFSAVKYGIVLDIYQEKMTELDALRRRVKILEESIKYNMPILFYEKLVENRNRPAGWNVIRLDGCNDEGYNKYIKHDKEKGCIKVLPGKYIISAEGTAHYVERHIIQITNTEKTLKANGSPQMSNCAAGWTTSTSRVLRQVITVKEETDLIFRWWIQQTRNNGGLYDDVWPKNELGEAYVAGVTIQRT
eukprot:486190_1